MHGQAENSAFAITNWYVFFNPALSIMFHVQRAYLWEPLRLEDSNTRKAKRGPFSRPDTGQVRLLRMWSFAVPRIRIKQR